MLTSGKRWSDGNDREPVFEYRFTGDLRLIDDGQILSTMYTGTVSVGASDKWEAITLLGKHFQVYHGELYRAEDGHKLKHVASIRNGVPLS